MVVCYRSEEHTSELQSLRHLVCRLLLEKKKNRIRAGIVAAAVSTADPNTRVRRACNPPLLSGNLPAFNEVKALVRTASLCFFFNDTATTEIYTLSLHDALPI